MGRVAKGKVRVGGRPADAYMMDSPPKKKMRRSSTTIPEARPGVSAAPDNKNKPKKPRVQPLPNVRRSVSKKRYST